MGITAAVVGGTVAATTAASVGTGIAQSEAQKDIAKAGLKQQRALSAREQQIRDKESAKVEAEASIAREQLRAAEEGRLRVTSMLGAPGTYGPQPGEGTPFALGLQGLGTPSTIQGGLFQGRDATRSGAIASGKINKKTGEDTGAMPWEVEGYVMSPEEIAAGVTSQPQFAAVSQMVAESNQLMNRTGPLWNQLNNSVVGSVYESSAALQRQQMEEISRAMASGTGGARRAGLQLAQRFKVQEGVNQQRTNELWKAKLGLEEFRVTQAQSNLSFAQSWVDNQAGIRDKFTAALTGLRTYWSDTIPAAALGASSNAQAIGAQAIANSTSALMDANNTKWNAINGAVEGAGGLVAMVGAGVQTGLRGT
jgi:hypothetical protein